MDAFASDGNGQSTVTALWQALSPAPAATADEGRPVTPKEQWGTKRRIAELIEHLDDDAMDELIDRVTRMGGGPKFITKFFPQASWLWRQWSGTVLQHTWKPALLMMLVSSALVAYMETNRTWPLLEVPSESSSAVRNLFGLNKMWSYLLTFATFVNSFFLSQSYGFWLATKGNVRKVQGRLNDLGLLLATHAERDEETGRFSVYSRTLLDDVARYTRLFHMLFYAGMVRPARGDEGASISVLRTDRGLARLMKRGCLTKAEHDLLVGDTFRVPETQRHSVVLQWITARFVQARRAGKLDGGAGFESLFLDKALLLRAVCASIADDAAARMPLAYVHLVQILVDVLVVLAPFALYGKIGFFTIPLVGVLTIFFRGFLALSKSFLDPFGNEDSLSENMSVHCLLCETNAGSIRWSNGIEELPFGKRVPLIGTSEMADWAEGTK